MSHTFVRPMYDSSEPPSLVYASGRLLSDNYARLFRLYNGGLHNCNLSPDQEDFLPELVVKFGWQRNPAPMVGTRHNHDGYQSSLIGDEAITFETIGGAFDSADTDPQSFGILFSGMDSHSVVVHTGSVYFDVLNPTIYAYTRSLQDGGFYRVIAVPFNGPKWGGSSGGYMPADSTTYGATRVFTSIRTSRNYINNTHTIRSNLWASMFSWTAANNGGIQVSSYITVWLNNRNASALYRDLWVDWAVIGIVQ